MKQYNRRAADILKTNECFLETHSCNCNCLLDTDNILNQVKRLSENNVRRNTNLPDGIESK